MLRRYYLLTALAALAVTLLSRAPASAAQAADDGQWTMASKDYANTRYSALNQITAANVGRLQPAFTFSTGVNRGQEAAPLVVDGTMFIVTPYPNHRLRARPDKARRAAEVALLAHARCPPARGSPAATWSIAARCYWQGKIIFNTLDGQTIALSTPRTGQELWHTKLGDINRGETITMAPLVVKGKVLVGNSGGEFGVRGWIQALDADTGKVAWKAYPAPAPTGTC